MHPATRRVWTLLWGVLAVLAAAATGAPARIRDGSEAARAVTLKREWARTVPNCSAGRAVVRTDGATAVLCARTEPQDSRLILAVYGPTGALRFRRQLGLFGQAETLAAGPGSLVAVVGNDARNKPLLRVIRPDGTQAWSYVATGFIAAAAFDPSGDVYPVRLDARFHPSLVRVGAGGQAKWRRALHTPVNPAWIRNIGYDAGSRSVYLAGQVDFNELHDFHGSHDTRMVAWRISDDGEVRWQTAVDSAKIGHPDWSDVEPGGLTVTETAVWIVGRAGWTDPNLRDAELDVLVVELSKTGAFRGHHEYGGVGLWDTGTGIAASPEELYVTGATSCETAHDCGPGKGGGLLAVLSPGGRILTWRPRPTRVFAVVDDVGLAAAGGVVVLGRVPGNGLPDLVLMMLAQRRADADPPGCTGVP